MRSTRVFSHVLVPAGLLAFVVLPLLSGCGGDKKTTVTVKPSKKVGGTADGKKGSSNGGGTPAAGGFGTFEGTVIFDGDAPTLRPLVAKGDPGAKDAATCSLNAVPNESLRVGPNKGVENVFIYLTKAPKGAKVPAVPTAKKIWDQKGCKFIPHCQIVRVNQMVSVKSNDPIAHNTHAYPKRQTGFNAVIKASDRTGADFTYGVAEFEPVEVKCDFHTWMIGYQLPLKHNFATLTDASGKFKIENLPSGVHRFQVWHESAQGKFLYRNFKVAIKNGETTTQEWKYPVAKLVTGYRPAAKSVTISALIDR